MPRPVANPPNPWHSTHVEWLGEPPAARLEVYEEEARTILSRNDSPDVPFTWSVNPYRGCQHACAYCYARPTHQNLDWGAGTDFDTRIVVKTNAPELLSRELTRPSLRGEWVAFSGVTDCYQPLEATYELTRRCLEVCLARRTAVGIVTKGALVRRDVDLLARLAATVGAEVHVSIPFADEASGRKLEPLASAPAMRFETLRILADAGIPVGVAIAPIIPGLNDSAIPEILERAHEAGARSAFHVLLRLPMEVRAVFTERLQAAFPGRAKKVLSALAEMRGGSLAAGRFGARMGGVGERWNTASQLFRLHARRLGFRTAEEGRPRGAPGRERTQQGELF